MKNRCMAIFAILLGLSLLGSARAETLKSKLADIVAAAASDSQAMSQERALVAPADEGAQQAPKTDARDAVNQAPENARDVQQ